MGIVVRVIGDLTKALSDPAACLWSCWLNLALPLEILAVLDTLLIFLPRKLIC